MDISYVDIVKFDGERNVLLARCVWKGSGAVEVTGLPEFVSDLQSIIDPFGNERTPTDGLEYLDAVVSNFRTPYLMATAIQKGEPPAAKFG
jgi:hypothetical protein